MKTRNPNKIQKCRLYTSKYYSDYPDYNIHMLYTSKSPNFSIFYAAGPFIATKINFFLDLTFYPPTKLAIKNVNE